MSDTRRESHEAISSSLGQRKREVYSAIWIRNKLGMGYTAAELAYCLDKPVGPITARLRELRLDGFIKDSGDRRVNPDTGRRQTVWVLGEDYEVATTKPCHVCSGSGRLPSNNNKGQLTIEFGSSGPAFRSEW